MRIDLAKPLAPGASLDMDFAWHFTVPEQGAGRMGRDGALYEIAQWYPRMAVYDDVRGWNHEPYIGAGEFYLFPQEYYRVLRDGLGERLGVALALHDGEPVGGALFLADRRFAHYHLSGTTDAGRELKAGTLLVHGGAEWARAQGCELLHLGGGTSGADSLFAFKKSFGGETFTYAFATLIADQERYDALVARRSEESEPARPEFFPAYRA